MGRATIEGQDWAIRCATECAAGTRIQVEGAEGIVLIVRKVQV
jgi:membrane protein implicated in regulation of membrane protease activity